MPADEYGHARIVQAAAMDVGGLPGRTLAKIEGRRRSGDGNSLRAAVLGANDGLVSNLSLVMGVAGAAAEEDRKSTRLNPVTNAHLVCRLLLEKKKNTATQHNHINRNTTQH